MAEFILVITVLVLVFIFSLSFLRNLLVIFLHSVHNSATLMCIYLCKKVRTFEFGGPRMDLSHSSKKSWPATNEIGKQNTETNFFFW
jgi:hypothetical protein